MNIFNLTIILSYIYYVNAFNIINNIYLRRNIKNNVTIIGTSISGLSAGIALRNNGYNVNIYDKKSLLKPAQGYTISLFENGLKSLNKICPSALAEIKLSMLHKNRNIFYDTNNNLIKTRGINIDLISYYSIKKALLNNFPKENIHLNSNFNNYTFDEDTKILNVNFDNININTNILIGADGIKSRVRDCSIGSKTIYYYDKKIFRGIVKKDKIANNLFLRQNGDSMYWMEKEPGNLFTWREIGDNYMAFAGIKKYYYNRKYKFTKKNEIKNIYYDYPIIVNDIINQIDENDIRISNINDIDVCDKWCKNNVILIGDAAHAMTPGLGMGINMDFEDAAELMYYLNPKKNIEENVKLWEESRKKRTMEIHSISRHKTIENNRYIYYNNKYYEKFIEEIKKYKPP